MDNNQEQNGFTYTYSAKEQAEVARVYYAAANAEHNLRHITGPEGHRFYAALGWPAFDELTGWKEN